MYSGSQPGVTDGKNREFMLKCSVLCLFVISRGQQDSGDTDISHFGPGFPFGHSFDIHLSWTLEGYLEFLCAGWRNQFSVGVRWTRRWNRARKQEPSP